MSNQSRSNAKATEYFCLAESGSKCCIGWNETCCQASIVMAISNYSVTLPPGSFVEVNGSIVGTSNVESTILITDQQAWAMSEWIQSNIPKPKSK